MFVEVQGVDERDAVNRAKALLRDRLDRTRGIVKTGRIPLPDTHQGLHAEVCGIVPLKRALQYDYLEVIVSPKSPLFRDGGTR